LNLEVEKNPIPEISKKLIPKLFSLKEITTLGLGSSRNKSKQFFFLR
jgi:hypothetical protein